MDRPPMAPELGQKLLGLKNRIVASFDAASWQDLAELTGQADIILGHPRLLRSLHWQDDDYEGHVLPILRSLVEANPSLLKVIEEYVDSKTGPSDMYISAKPSERRITFAPNVFQVPEVELARDLVAVMMPFSADFKGVFESISHASAACGFRCIRADSIWQESVIVQEIFNLIFQAQVVVVDFTGRNPNVMYETGIAHTLGKHVVPISQSLDDVPFDMRHHRVLRYLLNSEGLSGLTNGLATKLRQFQSR
jgi:hypothetical protein